MRGIISLSIALAALAVSQIASAVELTVTGVPAGPLHPGDLITLNVRLSNNSLTPVFGIGCSVWGYGGNMEFVSGVAVNRFLCPSLATCATQGLENLSGTPSGSTQTLSQTSVGSSGPRVLFINSISLTAHSQNGSTDPGLDGVSGTTQFRVTLRAISGGTGSFTLRADSSYNGDAVVTTGGALAPMSGQSFNLTVAPPVPILPYVVDELR